MIVVGLDVGRRRIGVAASDPTGFLASGVRVIQRATLERDVEAVRSLVESLGAAQVVVGYPLSMSGEAGPQAEETERFVEALRLRTSVPVILWDERLSTLEADRRMQEAGVSGRERRQRVDVAAAILILQSYLDSIRGQR
ncbi:MAG: Holliday junction resolvase RuvX [Chloroflexi bacterium]|nr:Holliday junction resolvase RuvX [Chloroflexota bacterium]